MSIEVKNLCAAYNERVILSDVNLKIPKGRITMLIGQNGCGKSTLLKSMARILPAKKGDIFLEGKNMAGMTKKAIARRLAVLPQSPVVPEGILVKDLVGYGRFPYQKPLSGLGREDHKIINWAMEKTGVYELRERKVEQLSGGQRQRVWLALALAQKTGVLLLDEPTTYLDMAHQLEILELLKKLNQEEEVTIVVVIHELNHAAKFGDHIVGLKNGEVLFEGTPEDVICRENLRNLYEIDAVLVNQKEKGYPICMDYSLIRR